MAFASNGISVSGLASGAAVFDASEYGRFRVSGEDALDLLDRLSTNDLANLPIGAGAATALTTNKGRLIDLLRILRRADGMLMITSPETKERVTDWIEFYTFAEDITVADASADTSHWLIAGGGSQAALSAAGFDAGGLDIFLAHAERGGATVFRSGFGDLPAYEIILPADAADPFPDAETLTRADMNRLRVEAGVPAHPAEINESRNPLEANLKPYISFNKGCYIGQEVVARLNTYDRVQRFLCRLDLGEGVAAEPRAAVTDAEGAEIGEITSAAPGFALAYIRKRHCEDGARVSVSANGGGTIEAVLRDIRPPAYFE